MAHQSEIDRAQERAEELRRGLREDVAAEVRGNFRRRAWRDRLLRCGGCCLGYVAVFLVVIGGFAVVIARTGLVAIPFVSAHVRHATAPARLVTAAPSANSAVVIRDAFRRAAGRSSVEVPVSESILTALVRSAVRGHAPDRLADTVQIAVMSGNVQAFGMLDGIGATTTVRADGALAVRDGAMRVELRSVELGAVRIPRFLLRMIADRLTWPVPALPGPVGRTSFTVSGVALEEGRAVVTLRAAP